MSVDSARLSRKAEEILRKNWKGGYTVPRPGLYPFQWNWDSGFIALGWSHIEPARVIAEMRTLFSGQWENGMLPHIVFHSENETTYFPNHEFWDTSVNSGAPRSPKTSGISQPPVHAYILEKILLRRPGDEACLEFLEALYDPLCRMHRWWYTCRDPRGEGLASIVHPWESGRDNSPLWDSPMDKIDLSEEKLPPYERKDTAHADAAERPVREHYDKYVFLLELAKKYRYDGRELLDESPFCVQDTMLNAILIAANESLVRIGRRLGREVDVIEAWVRKAKSAFREKLWNQELGAYCCFDLHNGCQLPFLEVGAFTALLAGIPGEGAAARMIGHLEGWAGNGLALVPSFDPRHPLFDSRRYWRGPVWPQMNWLIREGLIRYGMKEEAERVRGDLLGLVGRFGFYEYFEPRKELHPQLDRGYGGNGFSWTAAAILDFINTP